MGLRARKEGLKTRQIHINSVSDQLHRPRKAPPKPWLTIAFAGLIFISIFVISHHSRLHHEAQQKSLFSSGSKQTLKKDKKGHVVHKAITSVKKEDLKGLVDIGDLPDNVDSITREDAIKGREQLVAILEDAGVEDIDIPTILSLPKWSDVTKLYGDGPVIVGLDRCEDFRNNFPLDDASIGTAGLFNTGTNPFAMYIQTNCKMPHNTHDKHGGTRWQVPVSVHICMAM
jgi:hypothetical protein